MKKKDGSFLYYFIAMILIAFTAGSILFLSQYNPAPSKPATEATLNQKMAYLQEGASLPSQETSLYIPRWLMMLILGFVVIQIIPLLLASRKARAAKFTRRQLRQIEFLTETPLFFGLLGSLLGVCLTQFITGTLSAPLAYLTTISGILLYLFGRFTILVSLPSQDDMA